MAAGQISEAAEQAAALPPDSAVMPSFSWSGYFMSLAVLCLLLAALWFALRFIKRRGGLRAFGGNEDLRLESRFSIGPKKNLLVVRLADRRLVLGVTDHHISRLAELPLHQGEDDDEKN